MEHPDTRDQYKNKPKRFDRFMHALDSDDVQTYTVNDVQAGTVGVVFCSAAATNGVSFDKTNVHVILFGAFSSAATIVQTIGRANRNGKGGSVTWFANKASFTHSIAAVTARLAELRTGKKHGPDDVTKV